MAFFTEHESVLVKPEIIDPTVSGKAVTDEIAFRTDLKSGIIIWCHTTRSVPRHPQGPHGLFHRLSSHYTTMCILQILFSHRWIYIRKKDAVVTEKKVKVTVLLPLTVVMLTASGAAGEGEVIAVKSLIISVVLRHGVVSMQRCRHTGIGIPIINIRRSWDRLIFIMEIPISGKTDFVFK